MPSLCGKAFLSPNNNNFQISIFRFSKYYESKPSLRSWHKKPHIVRFLASTDAYNLTGSPLGDMSVHVQINDSHCENEI